MIGKLCPKLDISFFFLIQYGSLAGLSRALIRVRILVLDPDPGSSRQRRGSTDPAPIRLHLKKTKPWARSHTIRPNHLPGFCLLIVRRLRPPIDVDHQLPQDLGCGVVQPKSSPDGGEVANRIHYFQDPPRRLPVLARCLPQNKNID